MKKNKAEWRVIVDLLKKVDAVLLNKITRRMIYYLYSRNITEIMELVKGFEPSDKSHLQSDELYQNVPHPIKDQESLNKFVEKVFEIAGKTLPANEISKQISMWMAQEKSRFLSILIRKCNTPLMEIKDALNRFFKIAEEERYISPDEYINLRVSLIRQFLSENLPYINIAKKHITIREFSELLNKVIGPSQGIGKLGGKSAGMILGYKILENVRKKI